AALDERLDEATAKAGAEDEVGADGGAVEVDWGDFNVVRHVGDAHAGIDADGRERRREIADDVEAGAEAALVRVDAVYFLATDDEGFDGRSEAHADGQDARGDSDIGSEAHEEGALLGVLEVLLFDVVAGVGLVADVGEEADLGVNGGRREEADEGGQQEGDTHGDCQVGGGTWHTAGAS